MTCQRSCCSLVLAVILTAVSYGCGEPARPPTKKAILHVCDGSEAFLDDVVGVLLKNGIRAERKPWADTALAERGGFAVTETGGWLLLVPHGDAAQALEIFSQWASERGSATIMPPEDAPSFVLGEALELDEGRLRDIRSELRCRVQRDQSVRDDPGRHTEMRNVDGDNTAYLKKLVSEIGWIDATRFGRDAAEAAFLLTQHSGDVPLMKAALPEVEKDVRAGRLDGQPFALLYDRLHLMTGGKQRYGTQVVVKADGREIVERLEDPGRVDERRRNIGLGPLAEYLKRFGGEVRVER